MDPGRVDVQFWHEHQMSVNFEIREMGSRKLNFFGFLYGLHMLFLEYQELPLDHNLMEPFSALCSMYIMRKQIHIPI